MILTQADLERFEDFTPTQREDFYETQRTAKVSSPAGVRREAEALLNSLCQAVFAATWVPGFEAEAWHLVHQNATTDTTDVSGDPQTQGLLRELYELTIDAGWWPVFDHPQPDPWTLGRVVDLQTARALFDHPTTHSARD